MPCPMRSGSRCWSTSSTECQSSTSPACTVSPRPARRSRMQRARLDQLGPAAQREEVLERLPLLPADGDEIHELPVVLRRKTDALLRGDAPHRSGVDRAAEVDMELRELVAEWVRRS